MIEKEIKNGYIKEINASSEKKEYEYLIPNKKEDIKLNVLEVLLENAPPKDVLDESVCIVVFHIKNSPIFSIIHNFFPKGGTKNKNCKYKLVGNKADSNEDRFDNYASFGKALKIDYSLEEYYKTFTITGKNVHELFSKAAKIF